MKITDSKEEYLFDYPQAEEFTRKQLEVFWLPDEADVSKDVQDLMVNMTPQEKHGVVTTLKLFTLYELIIGNEFWGGRVRKAFPRPEVNMMAATFSMMELAVHAPFYAKINEVMMLNTPEFYNAWKDDEELALRMDFLSNYVSSKNLLLSIGVFTLVEGAILYSNFAFLKHFQAKGKNKILNICRGINFAQRDENLHSEASAWLFRELAKEYKDWEVEEVKNTIAKCAETVFQHEHRIAEKIFEEGNIPGITLTQISNFVQSRINLCLKNLEISPIYKVDYNPIAEWFYKGNNMIQFHDFFSGTGNEYSRNWDSSRFIWEDNNIGE